MDGIIFDLDGTLWDSTEEVTKCWNKVLAEETDIDRVLTVEELKPHFGKQMNVIMGLVFPDLTEEECDSLATLLFERENVWVTTAPCHIYEGVLEGVKELASQMPIFIVSNCQAGYIEAFLEYSKLGAYITDHTCPGDTGMSKGKNIRLIMERNNLKDVIYVGDTRGDEEACIEAEVPFVYAAYGFGEAKNPYRSIESFEELRQNL